MQLIQIKIFHTGYSTNIVQEKNKSKRNIELLYRELDKTPNSSNVHFYLAEGFNLDGNIEKVLYHVKEVFRHSNANLRGVYQKSYFYQLSCMIELKDQENEIQDIYNQAIKYDNTYPDYDMLMGNYYSRQKEYKRAIIYFNKCIEKMNEYEGDSESWAIANARQVFKVVADLFCLMEEYEQCVKYYIFILNVYKDDDESLTRLLEILNNRISREEIFTILITIYDMTVEQDKLIVLRACVALKDPKLSAFVKELLDN